MKDSNNLNQSLEPEHKQTDPKPIDKKGQNKILIPLAIILVLIFIGLITYIIYTFQKPAHTNYKSTTSNSTSVSTSTTNTSTSNNTSTISTITADPFEDWLTYTNPTFGYSFRYPSNIAVKEYPVVECEGDGGDCYSVTEPGEVISIKFGDQYIYLSSKYGQDTSNIESGWTVDKDTTSFDEVIVGDKKMYILVQYDDFHKQKEVTLICSSYRYQDTDTETILWHKDTLRINDYNFEINYGNIPLAGISENDFKEVKKVFETFEF
jgi:hypothetical protein